MKSWLLIPGPSPLTYVLRMGLTSFVPSVVVAVVLLVVLTPLGVPAEHMTPEFPSASRHLLFFLLVVFSPIVETIAMSAGIELISRTVRQPFVIAATSAVLWATLHSMAALVWGLVILWPFFVFSCAYLAWRPRGWLKAVSVAASIHMFQNLIPGMLLLLS